MRRSCWRPVAGAGGGILAGTEQRRRPFTCQNQGFNAQIALGALSLVLVAIFVLQDSGGDGGPAPQPSAAQARLTPTSDTLLCLLRLYYA